MPGRMPGRWAVTAPDGKKGYITGDLAEAVAAGYRPRGETPDELAAREVGAESGAQAFGEGALRGATLGLSDVPLASSATENEADVKRRMKARSKTDAATSGEVAGFTAGLLGPEELSLAGVVAKGGAGIAKKMGGKLVGRIAGGAAEGGVFGLTNAISEATLNNQPLAAEHIAANMAASALMGGAAGGAFHGLERGVKAGAAKLAGANLGGALGKLADQADAAMLRKAGGGVHEYEKELINVGRREGVISGKASFSDPLALERASQAKRNFGEQRMGRVFDQLPGAPDVNVVQADVHRAIDKFRKNPALDSQLATMDKYLDKLVLNTAPLSWRDLYFLSGDLRVMAEKGDRRVLEAGRKAMQEYVLGTADKALPPPVGKELRQAVADYASLAELEKIFKKGLKKNATGGLGGLMAGEAALGAVMGHPIVGVASAVATKLAAPRWGFMLSEAARGAEPFVKRLATGLQKRMAGLASAPAFTPFQLLLEAAAAHGPAALLAEHARIMQSSDGAEYASMMGTPAETPELLPAALSKAGAVHAVASFGEAFDKKLDGRVSGFLGEKPGRAATGATTGTQDDFEARMQVLRGLLSNPTSAHEAIPTELSAAAPNVSARAAMTTLKAAQYLVDAAPKSPYAGMPWGLQRDWNPPAGELAKWFRIARALEDPGAVLERMRHGRVSEEETKAVQAVYPAIVAELQTKIAARLGSWDKQLDYGRQAALVKAFGGRFGLSGDQMRVIAAAHAKVMEPAPKPKPDGRQKVDAQENMETQAQRLERRHAT